MVVAGCQTVGTRSVAPEPEPRSVIPNRAALLASLLQGFAHNVSYVKFI